MNPRVTELHCIMPVANIGSVVQYGILSYERAAKLSHHSVALPPVQERRDRKQVPGGRKLHRYANLYFHARNPMLYKRKGEVMSLCVLKVSPSVFDLDGVVLADCNASSDYARFLAPSQWQSLSFDDIYAMDWRHADNPARYYQHRSRKCAEVLVPDCVEVRYLTGAYVKSVQVKTSLEGLGFPLPVTIDPVLFFSSASGV